MVNSVTRTTQTQASAQAAAARQTSNQQAPSAESKSQPTRTVTPDNVQISNAARVVMQEAMETSFQTSQEAGKGDMQAQRKLANEQAAKKMLE
jgi:hypothetical protein